MLHFVNMQIDWLFSSLQLFDSVRPCQRYRCRQKTRKPQTDWVYQPDGLRNHQITAWIINIGKLSRRGCASCHSLLGAIFVLPWKTFIHHLPTLTAPNKPTTPIHLHPSTHLHPLSTSLALSLSLSLFLTSVGDLKKQHRRIVSGRPRGFVAPLAFFPQNPLLTLFKILFGDPAPVTCFSKGKVRWCPFLILLLLKCVGWLTAFDHSDRCWFKDRSIEQYCPPWTMVSAQRGAETYRFDSSDAAHRKQIKIHASFLGLFCLNHLFLLRRLLFFSLFDGASRLGRNTGLLRTTRLQDTKPFWSKK